MAKKRKGELPSGSIRRQIYDHSEPVFDESGKPVIDPKTGKQKQKRIYRSITASSVKEAERIKAEIIAQNKQLLSPQKMTLYEAIDKYIESADAVLSPSTIVGYRKIQRTAFQELMRYSLQAINAEILRDAVNAECKRISARSNQPIKPKTVVSEFRLIAAVLNRYAPGIPTDKVQLPQVVLNKHELSTPDVIFEMVKGTDIELPVLLAMWLSFTASEIIGLTKSKSLSADGNMITIKEVIVTGPNGPVIKENGKHPTRNRSLRLPDYIKNLIAQIETDRLVTMSAPALSKRFARLVKKSGIPHMTFHDLRHVNASVMSVLHVPDKYAQERGGWHSDSIMKSVYQQTFNSERAAVDQKINDYFDEIINGEKISEKYRCWLTLFDRNDDEVARKDYKRFCAKYKILA